MRRRLFFFNDPATTEIYTLSLHDALPIYRLGHEPPSPIRPGENEPHLGAGVLGLPVHETTRAHEAVIALVHDPPVRLAAVLVLLGHALQKGSGVLNGMVPLPKRVARPFSI